MNTTLVRDIIGSTTHVDILQSTERSTVSRTKYKDTYYIVKSKILNERADVLRFQLEVDIHAFLASKQETQAYVAGYIGFLIVQSYETGEGVEIPTTGYYIQENIQGVDLHTYLSTPTNNTAAIELINTLKKAVDSIHMYILHNDIKPENIVVVSPTDVKIIDFETACFIHEKSGYSSCSLQNKIGNPWGWGTPNYYPINIAEGSRKRKPYDLLMDRYALGKVILQIINRMMVVKFISNQYSEDDTKVIQHYTEDTFREYMEPVLRTNTHPFTGEDINSNTLVQLERNRIKRNYTIRKNTQRSPYRSPHRSPYRSPHRSPHRSPQKNLSKRNRRTVFGSSNHNLSDSKRIKQSSEGK
jgi:serine/threonine protein kinase